MPSRAALHLHAAFSRLLNTNAWQLRLWDGTMVQPAPDVRFVFTFRSRRALDLLIGGLPERAFGRAYTSGGLDMEPLRSFLQLMAGASPAQLLRGWARVVAAALALGARPAGADHNDAEAHLRGRLHSRERDAAAVRHHYDLPAEFYALFLDSSLTYSCAYFESTDVDIDTAQRAKLDLVCRKLRLRPGERLLDIGCGWGSLVLHAVQHYGVHGVGITLSPRQVETARQRAASLELGKRADFRLADYRDLGGERFDAVASIGMVEHVGRRLLGAYAQAIQDALRPTGRALVHGITCEPRALINRASFLNTFVFPDGELEDVGTIIRSLEGAGLEVRDVESLREHYALTLSHWLRRLEQNWDDAVRIAGPRRARTWRLYMTAAELSFRARGVSIHQTLAVHPAPDGAAGTPLTRADWYAHEAAPRAVSAIGERAPQSR
ncbi:MAG: class I SAM-dependent methyltransferase [Chloroflexi bacterium]|nr:MAG: class I SAM-dependent methyltransferase [Chloroflexota bacterium]